MTKDLTQGNPIKAIIFLAFPIMLGNLFQQLYSIADTLIVGRMIGSNALAAVGSTSSFYFLIMWFIVGMSGGYAIELAKRFGAGQMDALRKAVCVAFELATVITLSVTVISLIFIKKLLIIMNTPSEILADAYAYIVVIIVGMMATMLYNTCASILRAMGDSKTPLYFLILASGINIVLDIVFIRYFHSGVVGAAYATVISQAFSGILCFFYMKSHFTELHFQKGDWKYDRDTSKQLLKYGLPSGLLGTTTAIGILILQFAINCYGADVIAGYTTAIKIDNFFELPIHSYAMAMMNFEGQNLGAGKYDNMKRGFRQCTILGMLTAFVCAIILFTFGNDFSKFFVDANTSAKVIEFSAMYLRIASFFLIIFSVLMITRSSLQGMGSTLVPIINGGAESVIRIVFTVILMHNLSEFALCLVTPTTWTIATLIVIYMYISYWKGVKASEKEKIAESAETA